MCDSLFHEIVAGNGESERPWPRPERQTDRQADTLRSLARTRVSIFQRTPRPASPGSSRRRRSEQSERTDFEPNFPHRFSKGGLDRSCYDCLLQEEGKSAAFWDVCVREERGECWCSSAVCFVRKQLNVVLMTEVFSCRGAPSPPR